jgi:hypothetical protein
MKYIYISNELYVVRYETLGCFVVCHAVRSNSTTQECGRCKHYTHGFEIVKRCDVKRDDK